VQAAAMANQRILLEAAGEVKPVFGELSLRLSSGTTRWPGVVLEEHAVAAGEFPANMVFLSHVIATLDLPEPLTQHWHEGGSERRVCCAAGDITLRSHQELQSCRWDKP